MDVDGAPLESGARHAAVAPGGDGIPLDEVLERERCVVGRDDPEELTVEAPDERAFGLAEPDRVLCQGLEDGLEIERRAPDDLEQLAGGRLLLERDPQLAVARLQLREQADVLDRNDGLIGKRLEERHVAVGECAGFAVADDENPEDLALAPEGYHHHAPHVVAPVELENAR